MSEIPIDDTDPLAVLRARIEATQEAASALAADAEAALRSGAGSSEGGIPRQGYSAPTSAPGGTDDDLRALLGVLETLRALVPAELQQQVSDIIRQVLLLLRALIDLWVARLEPGAAAARAQAEAGAPRVQDIPVG